MLHSLNSCALETIYERSCRKSESVYFDEYVRRLRVKILLSEDQCHHLREQLEQNGERIEEMEKYTKDIQDNLEVTTGYLESAEGDMRIRSREVETLKVHSNVLFSCATVLIHYQAELSSLQAMTMDSTKLLTEKLLLARELSFLKPEVEHLRSEAASHQSLLTEKLALQRQLSILQVELDNEGRLAKRTTTKNSKLQEEDSKVQHLVAQLQAELNKERCERQKAEREAHKKSTKLESKVTTLESRLDAFKCKLRTTEDLLKETQTKLQSARESNDRLLKNGNSTAHPSNPRKRAASRLDEDTMIGTPGDMPAAKKSRKGSVVVGEKSSFSITPFLNRTTSVASESPSAGPPKNRAVLRSSSASARRNSCNTMISQGESGEDRVIQREKGPSCAITTGFQTMGSAKVISNAASGRKPKVVPGLEQVIEEENERDVAGASRDPPVEQGISGVTQPRNVRVKQAKRKILGDKALKPLFDDHDHNAPRGNSGIPLGTKISNTLDCGDWGGASAFGAISPLKKEKRANCS